MDEELDHEEVRRRAEEWVERHLGPPIKKAIFWWKFRNYRAEESSRRGHREDAIKVLRREHQRFSELGMEHYCRVFNVGLFVLALDYDIQTLIWSFQRESDPWRANYFMRQLAVELYEASDDILHLLGKDFRGSLENLGLWEGAAEDLKAFSKDFGRFKSSHRVDLNELRTVVGAHREHDMATVFDVLDAFDSVRIMGLAADFSGPLRALVDFLIRLTLRLGDLDNILAHAPLKQMLAKGQDAGGSD